MASTYSPNLRLELIGTGEQQGTWGTTTNTNLGTLLEEAIGGYVSVTVSDVGDTTLTTNNGSADQSRNMVINLVGTISAARNVICPAVEKLYVIKNATTGGFDVTFKVSGQTGVTIPNGETYFLYVNGVDAQKIVGNVASTNVTNTFTENQIISVTDNTDAALRITQLGTGNAILVEDSANPDSTPLAVSGSGQLITGHTSAITIDGTTPQVQFHGPNSGLTSGVSDSAWLGSTAGPFLTLTKSRSITVGSNSIVASGDSLGEVRFYGDDGTGFVQAAEIQVIVDGTPGAGDMPGRIAFSTTADGASTPTERMRIDSDGNVGIGTSSPAYRLDVQRDDFDAILRVKSNPGGGTDNDAFVYLDAAVGGEASTYFFENGVAKARVEMFNSGSEFAVGTISGSGLSLALETESTNRVNILSDGKVGVGTVSPDALLSVNGIASFGDGAAATPSITNFGDLNTGMWFPAADTIAFSTAGAEEMRITSAGNVGIGTTSPSTPLHVNGAAQATTFEVGNASDTTISRVSAGVIAVEGGVVVLEDRGNTFTANTNTFASSGANTTLQMNYNNNGLTGALNRLRFLDTDTTTGSGQAMGIIEFGTSDTGSPATYTAAIQAYATGTSGGGALEFYTASNGANRLVALEIAGGGQLNSQATYDNTNAGAANMVVTSTGAIRRSSSSIKYKKDVEDLNDSLADNAVSNLRPVWYRSKNPNGDDKETWSHIGLIAEEVALIEPRLVSFRTASVSYDENGRRIETPLDTPEPEGVDYARLSVILLDVVQRQAKTIKSMEDRLAALEAKVQ